MEPVDERDRDAFVARYGPLFEHSPWVAEAAWERRPFHDREALMDALRAALHAAPRERQVELIRAHPDLAGRAAAAGKLTRASRSEQASAGLDRLTPEELATFRRLNAAYREKFGFPFVIAVRDHTKESILRAAAERLGHSREEEIDIAVGEIGRIAARRLEALA